jgi:hypothetical protein
VVGLGRVQVCPFDSLPCEYVESCDDVMVLRWSRKGVGGLDTENGVHCPRAVLPLK